MPRALPIGDCRRWQVNVSSGSLLLSTMLPGGLKEDDYDILEFLWNRDDGLVADPKTIAVNTGIGHDRVNNRIRVLLENGLLQRGHVEIEGLSSKGLYQTTDVGDAFASGDMTISELRDLVADRE